MSKLKEVLAKKNAEVVGRHYCDTDQEANEWFDKEYPIDHTIEIGVNPEITKREQAKAKWQAISDPAVKALLKPLLKDFFDE